MQSTKEALEFHRLPWLEQITQPRHYWHLKLANLCFKQLACAIKQHPWTHGDDSNITPAVTTTNVPGIARHPWEKTKSPLAEYHWVRLEPEARQWPLQPKLHTSKAKPPASTAHLSLLQEEPLLDAWEGFVYIRLAGQSPSYPAKCEPLCQREYSIKTPK